MTVSVLLAIPAYGGNIKTECALSIWKLQKELPAVEISTMAFPDISTVRNTFAARAIAGTYSHLLFSDNDIAFEPVTVHRMIEAAKPIVGCVIPAKALDFKLALSLAKTKEARTAVSAASTFNVRVAKKPIKDHIIPVDAIGTGLALIERGVFQRLIETGKIRKEVEPHPGLKTGGPLYGFFDQIQTTNGMLYDDFAFCRRWREAGGEIHALTNENIGHIGDFTYRANYLLANQCTA